MHPLHTRRTRTKLSDAQAFRKEGMFAVMGDDYLSDEDRTRIVEEVKNHLLETTKLHFPRTGNLEYAILKSHLIIENVLTQYIRCTSHVLVEPEQIRFTFAQKLEIAILHGFGNACPTSVPSVELLNKVRNQVAHKFEFDRDVLNELIRINSENIDPKQLSDRQRIACLRHWCYYICGTTAGELSMGTYLSSRAETSRQKRDKAAPDRDSAPS